MKTVGWSLLTIGLLVLLYSLLMCWDIEGGVKDMPAEGAIGVAWLYLFSRAFIVVGAVLTGTGIALIVTAEVRAKAAHRKTTSRAQVNPAVATGDRWTVQRCPACRVLTRWAEARPGDEVACDYCGATYLVGASDEPGHDAQGPGGADGS